MGTLIHKNTYKIRLAVKSKGKGKSGGMRIITHVLEIEINIEVDLVEKDFTIFLLAIYDKSAMENIDIKDLEYLIQEVENEIKLQEDNEDN
jgi:hypothetical protein